MSAAILILYKLPTENMDDFLDMLIEFGQQPEYLNTGADVSNLIVSGRPDITTMRVKVE